MNPVRDVSSRVPSSRLVLEYETTGPSEHAQSKTIACISNRTAVQLRMYVLLTALFSQRSIPHQLELQAMDSPRSSHYRGEEHEREEIHTKFPHRNRSPAMSRGSAWAGRPDRVFTSVEDPQQRRLAEWMDQDKQARRRAEFGIRIAAIAAQVASEVSAAVASEVSAAVAAALQSARAGHHEYLDLESTTTSTPTAPVADDLASPTAASNLSEVIVGVVTECGCTDLEPTAATLTLTSALDISGACSAMNSLALPTTSGCSAVVHTTCSTQCASRTVTMSVSATAPATMSASSKVTGDVVPELCCLDLEPSDVLELIRTPPKCSTEGLNDDPVVMHEQQERSKEYEHSVQDANMPCVLHVINSCEFPGTTNQVKTAALRPTKSITEHKLIGVDSLHTPWTPARSTTCRMFNVQGTLYVMQLSGELQDLETVEPTGSAPLTVIYSVPGVQTARLNPTVFKWSDLFCFATQFLSASTLDLLLAKRDAPTVIGNLCCEIQSKGIIIERPYWQLIAEVSLEALKLSWLPPQGIICVPLRISLLKKSIGISRQFYWEGTNSFAVVWALTLQVYEHKNRCSLLEHDTSVVLLIAHGTTIVQCILVHQERSIGSLKIDMSTRDIIAALHRKKPRPCWTTFFYGHQLHYSGQSDSVTNVFQNQHRTEYSIGRVILEDFQWAPAWSFSMEFLLFGDECSFEALLGCHIYSACLLDKSMGITLGSDASGGECIIISPCRPQFQPEPCEGTCCYSFRVVVFSRVVPAMRLAYFERPGMGLYQEYMQLIGMIGRQVPALDLWATRLYSSQGKQRACSLAHIPSVWKFPFNTAHVSNEQVSSSGGVLL
ncbi:hypothetical protein VPH35_058494 [Triticum aestivum]